MGQRDDGKNSGLGDAQGTRVATPATHNDGPSSRPEKQTGGGGEALIHNPDASEHDQEHRSGYGGKGGRPDTPSDTR